MGIARGLIKLLMREGKRDEFAGHVLTAGVQDIYAAEKGLFKWAGQMNFHLKTNVKIELADKVAFRQKEYISDKTFFLKLGFDNVDSMDYSDYEHCTIAHDLNKDIPENLYDKYDMIFDGGTSEHIFNFAKVLENFNKMLKVDGRIIHAVPSSNHIDHGFYMFSPTLFMDYYLSNKWNIIDIFLTRYSPRFDTGRWSIYSYEPGCLDKYSFGGLNSNLYGVFFVAQKTKESTFDAPVQQGSYIRTWNKQGRTINTQQEQLMNGIKSLLPLALRNAFRPIWCKINFRFFIHFNPIARY